MLRIFSDNSIERKKNMPVKKIRLYMSRKFMHFNIYLLQSCTTIFSYLDINELIVN